ncbi:unnamed protein product [Withania somnifera]
MLQSSSWEDNELLRRCLVGRAHGLPLHLWNKEVMKKIRDDCGSWLENEEETELNHLRWPRIRVRGPKENIQTKIEILNSKLIFPFRYGVSFW